MIMQASGLIMGSLFRHRRPCSVSVKSAAKLNASYNEVYQTIRLNIRIFDFVVKLIGYSKVKVSNFTRLARFLT